MQSGRSRVIYAATARVCLIRRALGRQSGSHFRAPRMWIQSSGSDRCGELNQTLKYMSGLEFLRPFIRACCPRRRAGHFRELGGDNGFVIRTVRDRLCDHVQSTPRQPPRVTVRRRPLGDLGKTRATCTLESRFKTIFWPCGATYSAPFPPAPSRRSRSCPSNTSWIMGRLKRQCRSSSICAESALSSLVLYSNLPWAKT